MTPTITANAPSSWNAAQAGYDFVILGHKSLLASRGAARARCASRRGCRSAVIDVQDLYDEFNFGVKSPHALKAFLANAKANWTTKPRFVLLLGNGTFDPRNYLATNVPDLVPVKLVDTAADGDGIRRLVRRFRRRRHPGHGDRAPAGGDGGRGHPAW